MLPRGPAKPGLPRTFGERYKGRMNPFGLPDVDARVHAALRLGTWVLRVDPSGTWELWWSPEVYRIHDMEPGTPVTPEMAASFFEPDALAKLTARFHRAVHEGMPFDLEAPMTTAKGRTVTVRTVGETLDHEGVRYVVGSIQDVSPAADNRSFLQSVIENFPQMIFVKEPKELRFKIFNKAGEDLLGIKAEDMLGKNDYDFFPPEQADHFIAMDRKVLEERQLVDIAEEAIDAPAGRRYLHTKKMPVFDAGGEPLFLLGISEDVTEAKRSRELIQKQQQALFQSVKMAALGEMASGIAHEVNNPLTIIQGYVYKARSQLTEAVSGGLLVPGLGESLAGIDGTVQRIATVIKGLRSFSREGRDPVQWVLVAELIEDTINLCRERFRLQGIELRLSALPPRLRAYCSETEISQALLHLINNAIDAVRGTREAWIEVAMAYLSEAGVVEISVTDCGPPIPARIRAKIFQPFFSTKQVGKNVGLGLGIARDLIENHGGTLELDDRADCVHPRFVIKLPAE